MTEVTVLFAAARSLVISRAILPWPVGRFQYSFF